MKEITISGTSDDLVEVTWIDGADEFCAEAWSADLVAPDGARMHVSCWYADTGTWQVGVGQAGEDHPLPGWPLSVRQGRGRSHGDEVPEYSVALVITAPDGTVIDNISEHA